MQSPFLSFTLALLLELAAANYDCLCSYNVQDAVYDSPYNEDNRLGILYEFDCKPTFKMTTSIPPQWQAIQFEKKVGYVALDDKTQVQTCPGVPSKNDLVPPMATDTTTSSTSNLPSSSISTLRSTPSIPTTKLSTRRSVMSSTRQTIKQQCPPQIPQSRYNIEFNQHCYEFILRVHKTWPDAEHDCRRKGGHLVTINSMTEQKFIYTSVQQLHLHDGDLDIWTGLSDQRVEGVWKWASGENSSFTYWDTNEPKTSVMGDFEDCVMMEMDRAGRWGDVPCTGFMFSHQHHGYVCEYEKV